MEPKLLAALLASIATDSLVIVCGAGLSRTEPSRVPPASELAQSCARRFTQSTGSPVPDGAETDLEKLAEFFFAQPDFWRLFLEKLIDWGPFKRGPNAGHIAIADFLCCGATRFVITTNFDVLIEVAAEELGEPLFRAALDGSEMQANYDHRSALKLHGCLQRDLNRTLWCRAQTGQRHGDATIRQRLDSSEMWLRANLQGRHILIVGFWSDWPHLNDALSRALDSNLPAAITVVDINDDDQLKRKAPSLWNVAEQLNDDFQRVRASGTEFLDELRREHALRFFSLVLVEAIPTYLDIGGTRNDPVPVMPTDLTSNELYQLKRDLCGVPPGEVVRDHAPSDKMRGAGAVHLLLQEKGWQFSGDRYVASDGTRIRVVNGASDSFHRVRHRFSKGQTQSRHKELVICVSSIDDGGAPADIVRGDQLAGDDIVRAATTARWLNLTEAKQGGFC